MTPSRRRERDAARFNPMPSAAHPNDKRRGREGGEMGKRLDELVREAYADKVSAFFEKVKAMNLTDKELSAIPSLFLPGWGENYESSFF